MKRINHRIRETILKNGSRFVSVEAPRLPYSIIAAGFRAGSRFDPPGRSGLTHLAEHLFMSHTPRFGGREKRLARLESLGVGFDAITHRETTLFYQSQLERALPQSLELFWDGLTNTRTTRAAVEREKSAIINEYREDTANPQWMLWQTAARALWPRSPLAVPVTGTPRTLKNITLKDVREQHRIGFHPSRAVFFAIGGNNDIAAAQTFFSKKSAAEKTTAPNAPEPQRVASKTSPLDARRISFCDAASRSKNHVPIGIFFETTSIRNEKDRIALSFIKSYLAGSWIARLIQELRIKRNHTYWVDADSEYFSDTGCLEFQFSTSPDAIIDAVAVALNECHALKTKILSSRETAPHKVSLTTSVIKGSQDPETMLSWYSQEPLLGADALGYQAFVSGIAALDGKTIRATAQKYLAPENATIVIGAPESAPLRTDLAFSSHRELMEDTA